MAGTRTIIRTNICDIGDISSFVQAPGLFKSNDESSKYNNRAFGGQMSLLMLVAACLNCSSFDRALGRALWEISLSYSKQFHPYTDVENGQTGSFGGASHGIPEQAAEEKWFSGVCPRQCAQLRNHEGLVRAAALPMVTGWRV